MRAARLTRLDGPDAVEVVGVDEPGGAGDVIEGDHPAQGKMGNNIFEIRPRAGVTMVAVYGDQAE